MLVLGAVENCRFCDLHHHMLSLNEERGVCNDDYNISLILTMISSEENCYPFVLPSERLFFIHHIGSAYGIFCVPLTSIFFFFNQFQNAGANESVQSSNY